MMPQQQFYVSPEQLMADRADFARKGIARGRSVIVAQYKDGFVFVTENPSKALHKFSEIYDRIAFAGVGKYNEFENLRVSGIRYADMRGYTYDRADVNARGLANAYAQTLGTVFTTESKPLEVELVVAEVGDGPEDDLLYRLIFDGSVAEENGFVVIGGRSSELTHAMASVWEPNLPLAHVLRVMKETLEGADPSKSSDNQSETNAQTVTSSLSGDHPQPEQRRLLGTDLEAAILDRTRTRRKFRRLSAQNIDDLLEDNS